MDAIDLCLRDGFALLPARAMGLDTYIPDMCPLDPSSGMRMRGARSGDPISDRLASEDESFRRRTADVDDYAASAAK